MMRHLLEGTECQAENCSKKFSEADMLYHIKNFHGFDTKAQTKPNKSMNFEN